MSGIKRLVQKESKGKSQPTNEELKAKSKAAPKKK
jgi:hypothetical protein